MYNLVNRWLETATRLVGNLFDRCGTHLVPGIRTIPGKVEAGRRTSSVPPRCVVRSFFEFRRNRAGLPSSRYWLVHHASGSRSPERQLESRTIKLRTGWHLAHQHLIIESHGLRGLTSDHVAAANRSAASANACASAPPGVPHPRVRATADPPTTSDVLSPIFRHDPARDGSWTDRVPADPSVTRRRYPRPIGQLARLTWCDSARFPRDREHASVTCRVSRHLQRRNSFALSGEIDTGAMRSPFSNTWGGKNRYLDSSARCRCRRCAMALCVRAINTVTAIIRDGCARVIVQNQ